MSTEVDSYFDALEHPLKDVMLAVRRVIVDADDRISESIKWKSPTFEYRGNLASINPRAKSHVSLMFHTGAQIPGDFPHLGGTGDVARYLRFPDLGSVDALRGELVAIVRAWVAMKESADARDGGR